MLPPRFNMKSRALHGSKWPLSPPDLNLMWNEQRFSWSHDADGTGIDRDVTQGDFKNKNGKVQWLIRETKRRLAASRTATHETPIVGVDQAGQLGRFSSLRLSAEFERSPEIADAV